MITRPETGPSSLVIMDIVENIISAKTTRTQKLCVNLALFLRQNIAYWGMQHTKRNRKLTQKRNPLRLNQGTDTGIAICPLLVQDGDMCGPAVWWSPSAASRHMTITWLQGKYVKHRWPSMCASTNSPKLGIYILTKRRGIIQICLAFNLLKTNSVGCKRKEENCKIFFFNLTIDHKERVPEMSECLNVWHKSSNSSQMLPLNILKLLCVDLWWLSEVLMV